MMDAHEIDYAAKRLAIRHVLDLAETPEPAPLVRRQLSAEVDRATGRLPGDSAERFVEAYEAEFDDALAWVREQQEERLKLREQERIQDDLRAHRIEMAQHHGVPIFDEMDLESTMRAWQRHRTELPADMRAPISATSALRESASRTPSARSEPTLAHFESAMPAPQRDQSVRPVDMLARTSATSPERAIATTAALYKPMLDERGIDRILVIAAVGGFAVIVVPIVLALLSRIFN